MTDTPTKRRWTDEQVEELRRLYLTDAGIDEVAEHFGVTPNAVRHVAHRYGIRRRHFPSSQDTWTAERVQYLVDNVATKTYEELAEHLGVTVNTVRTKATRLGVQRPYGWTPERVERLRAEVAEVGIAEMARRLGLSAETVRQKTKELGLTVQRPGRRVWTDERIAEFLAAYPTTPNEVLAERYGLSEKSVVETASRFGKATPVAPAAPSA